MNMPRPRRLRKVYFFPDVTFFKPFGVRDFIETILTIDEVEAIRLKDLEGMSQEEAAKKMKISQPTFHRLLLSARKKIADAIVNGKAIRVEGGAYKMAMPRGFGRMRRGLGPGGYCVCPVCGISIPHQPGVPCSTQQCPKCGARMVRKR